ncbi:MAG: LemA family protein [Sulfurospirillaceae bacterium]|nr:LemA family protein [Sulfurospirillaceae bacterium]MDD2825291.1 LemA family protein [Sulfurospirillaceae bacterium]
MQTFLIVVGIIMFVVILMYNSLIAKKNQVSNIFASLDAMLKKRYDLLPNLVASVQEYTHHEKTTLEQITTLRSHALSGTKNTQETIELDANFSKLLGGLMVSVENYPDLKANENFLHLQHTLNELEEQISAARRAYNQSVTDFNNALEMFPTNMMAGFMRLEHQALFETSIPERNTVDIKKIFKH